MSRKISRQGALNVQKHWIKTGDATKRKEEFVVPKICKSYLPEEYKKTEKKR